MIPRGPLIGSKLAGESTMDERPSGFEAELAAHTVSRDELARRGEEPGAVRCLACALRCTIRPSRSGVCKVRFNADGALRVPWGYTGTGLWPDPIEKKPFFHVLPGSVALSFGMHGCAMHCPHCQNWQISQALRDPLALGRLLPETAAGIAGAAVETGAGSVISTYNEPLVTAEWAAAVFDECKRRGLLTGFVSNGNATPEVLDYLRPRMDLFKADLKGFRDAAYRRLGAVLRHVQDGIAAAVARGFWVEVVTLLIPGQNDDPTELTDIARFLAGLSPDLPWHITAFHPDYRRNSAPPTTARALLQARDIGLGEGLRFVYLGNRRFSGDEQDTRCPACRAVLVSRGQGPVRAHGLAASRCAACGTPIPGIWSLSGSGAVNGR